MKKIILHCAAVPDGWAAVHTAKSAMAEVRAWHKKRGWRGEGYHFLVMPDGEIALGRPVMETGAHVAGHNLRSVGILMIESRAVKYVSRSWEHNFTLAQRDAVRGIVAGLSGLWPDIQVTGHNALDKGKLCPGFLVRHDDFAPIRSSFLSE